MTYAERHLTRIVTIATAAIALASAGCKDSYTISDPPAELTLDAQLRQTIGGSR